MLSTFAAILSLLSLNNRFHFQIKKPAAVVRYPCKMDIFPIARRNKAMLPLISSHKFSATHFPAACISWQSPYSSSRTSNTFMPQPIIRIAISKPFIPSHPLSGKFACPCQAPPPSWKAVGIPKACLLEHKKQAGTLDAPCRFIYWLTIIIYN